MKLELRIDNASRVILMEAIEQVGLNQLIDTFID